MNDVLKYWRFRSLKCIMKWALQNVCQKHVFLDLNSFLYVVRVWTSNIYFHAGSGGSKPLIVVESESDANQWFIVMYERGQLTTNPSISQYTWC